MHMYIAYLFHLQQKKKNSIKRQIQRASGCLCLTLRDLLTARLERPPFIRNITYTVELYIPG